MTTQTEIKRYTVEENLELEPVSEIRNEYHDGEMIAMTGGTPNHKDISGNRYILLKSALKGQQYRVFHVD